MVVLLFFLIIFGFLCLGAMVFTVSLLLPQARKHALSSALWCAVWGPCVIALLTLAGLAVLVNAISQQNAFLKNFAELLSSLGVAYTIAGLVGAFLVASVTAWLHHKMIHRMTFNLFRLYSCLVVAGIGSVWGWAINFWLAGKTQFPLGLLLLPVLCMAFGYGGFRWARQLRGEAPVKLTWITPEEFNGTR